jgi:peroxiredoxin
MRVCLSTSLVGLGLMAAVGQAADVPRYVLPVGGQVVVEGTRHLVSGNKTQLESVATYTVDVLSRRDDGAYRVVALVDSGGTAKDPKYGAMNIERVVEASVAYIHPGGQLEGEEDPLVNLARLFPRLPANEQEWKKGWEDVSADHGRIMTFRSLGAPREGTMLLEGQVIGGMAWVFEPNVRYRMELDAANGLPRRLTLDNGLKDVPYATSGSFVARPVKMLSAVAVKNLAGAANQYEQTMKAYRAEMKRPEHDMGRSAMVTSAHKAFDKACKGLVARIQHDGGEGEAELKNASNAMAPDPPGDAVVLRKQAEEWTLKDIDGMTHSLSDYRGKVVVLDFGDRGCSWCIRQMPQLVAMHDRMKDKGVVILGMALDTEVADAAYVARGLRLPYTTLMAASLVGKYPVRGTPSVILVDQQGMMRRQFVGYSMLGGEVMEAAVEELLNER